MILHAQAKHGKRVYPAGVFCTVFPAIATNGKKWARRLPTTHGCMLISSHGGSAAISVDGFDDVTDLLRKTLVSYNILEFWLVGVLAWRTGGDDGGLPWGWRGFVGLLSKAGIRGCKMLNNVRNVSVPIANGRSVFCTEPLTAVFADWYQQPVFCLAQ